MITQVYRLRSLVGRCLLALTTPPAAAQLPPIIDMHMHANPADTQGPPPVIVCAPYENMPLRNPHVSDARYAAHTFEAVHCRHPIWSGRSDDEVRKQSLAMLKRFNMTAVVGGPLVERWRQEGGDRVIPSLEFGMSDAPPIDRIRQPARNGELRLLGEISEPSMKALDPTTRGWNPIG